MKPWTSASVAPSAVAAAFEHERHGSGAVGRRYGGAAPEEPCHGSGGEAGRGGNCSEEQAERVPRVNGKRREVYGRPRRPGVPPTARRLMEPLPLVGDDARASTGVGQQASSELRQSNLFDSSSLLTPIFRLPMLGALPLVQALCSIPVHPPHTHPLSSESPGGNRACHRDAREVRGHHGDPGNPGRAECDHAGHGPRPQRLSFSPGDDRGGRNSGAGGLRPSPRTTWSGRRSRPAWTAEPPRSSPVTGSGPGPTSHSRWERIPVSWRE